MIARPTSKPVPVQPRTPLLRPDTPTVDTAAEDEELAADTARTLLEMHKMRRRHARRGDVHYV